MYDSFQSAIATKKAKVRLSITGCFGFCAEEALEVNPGFVSRMTRGVPYVWIKVAASMDGRTALANGASQWITGPQARADGHHWRARSCVVMTGIGTVRADDPKMNVRYVVTPRQPRRAVIDPGFDISEQASLLEGGEVIIFTGHTDVEKAARLAARGVQVVLLPEVPVAAQASGRPRVDLPAMMRWLAEQEVNEVHVEAGSGLNGALISAGCVDELVLYVAPMLLGEGNSIAQLPGFEQLNQAPRFEFIDVRQLGADVRLRARASARWQDLLEQIHLN